MTNDKAAEFQRKTLEAMRAQHEAYLTAVKTWRDHLAEGGQKPPEWPQFTPPNLAPQTSDLAEASYAFAAKLLAEQSKFMEDLSKAMAAPNKKS
jgi:hypothetical protein